MSSGVLFSRREGAVKGEPVGLALRTLDGLVARSLGRHECLPHLAESRNSRVWT